MLFPQQDILIERKHGMALGTLILLGLVVGEVVTIVKVGKQSERIEKLEKAAKPKKKES